MSLGRNKVVWASAGTGKTRRLVQVYLELLERGADPLRIVAMTFTEKAAAEMRDRIRSAIYAKVESLMPFRHTPPPLLNPGGVSTVVPAFEKNAAAWMRVLSQLPAAPISTIHGFCGLLLREQGLELGIDPSFTILDEQRSLDLARESAIETLRHEIRNGNAEAENLFGDFGRDQLVNTIVSAGYWLNSLGADEEWIHSKVRAQKQDAARLEVALREEMRSFGETFDAIGVFADEVEAAKRKHVLRKRDDAGALLPRIGQIAGVEAAAQLSRLVCLSVERFRSSKRASNALDFDDLLLGARDLLRKSPNVRTRYSTHFQAFLLDEFQDTDEVQAEIIRLLTEDPERPGKFAEGKLLIVGDPKQSIYRFRRAKVTVFFDMLRRIREEGGTLEHLQENHRSAQALNEFSNRLSQNMMDGMGKKTLDPANLDLSYRIRFSADDALISKSTIPFLGITYIAAEPDARAATGREMEAEGIARLLRKWKAGGTIKSWKEVALLLRVMTNVEVYLGALEAQGIPVYVVQGSLFYQKSEVSDLIAMLELVLHPEDSLLLSTVLSSALAGLTFRELFDGRRSEALDRILAPWIVKRDQATAAEILQDVIRKTNFDVVMMSQKNGRQRVANIGKLIEITRELARQGTTGLEEVVRHLRERATDTSVRESEAQIAGEEDDVVRILTVHQAKGLEFDIVIVPDLAARTARSSGDRTFFSDRWGFLTGAAYGLHRRTLPHSLILQARELEDDQQYEEEKRLLYVAVTRAKKMLVLGEGFARQAGPWLQWVHQLLESVQPGAVEAAREGKPGIIRFKGRRGEPDFSVQLMPASRLTAPEQLSLVTESEDTVNAEYTTLRDLQFDVSKVSRPPVSMLEVTPSELNSLSGCLRRYHWTRILGLVEPGIRPAHDSSSRRVGLSVHKALETGLHGPDLPELTHVYESEEWLDLARAEPERELPFMMQLRVDGRECLVRGRMDAVVPGDPPRVIDYKYFVWKESSEHAYDVPMFAYCLALMKDVGADRAVGELWFLKPPMKIVRKEYDRSDAAGQLQSVLRRYLNALDREEWPGEGRAYCDMVQCGFRSRCWEAAHV